MSAAHDLLHEAEQAQLVEAITRAESRTSGEIRIHLENWCWFGPQWRARRVFRKLGMQHTQAHTGVLIYVAVRSHKIAIIGDSGINQVVPAGFWDQIVEQLRQDFRAKRFAQGLTTAVEHCGLQLASHFPGNSDNPNELTNEISFG
ncbi:MAG: TPM domain-containing protein [Bacteroidetes bacterium]|nr:TPM domain-containing protein [Bacteroidota bacterium]